MAQRSRGKGEDLTNVAELLRILGEGRRALNRAQGQVRPFGTTYHALAMVLTATDTLAYYLTGNATYFHEEWHKTP